MKKMKAENEISRSPLPEPVDANLPDEEFNKRLNELSDLIDGMIMVNSKRHK